MLFFAEEELEIATTMEAEPQAPISHGGNTGASGESHSNESTNATKKVECGDINTNNNTNHTANANAILGNNNDVVESDVILTM
jgi:hypothetical protein